MDHGANTGNSADNGSCLVLRIDLPNSNLFADFVNHHRMDAGNGSFRVLHVYDDPDFASMAAEFL